MEKMSLFDEMDRIREIIIGYSIFDRDLIGYALAYLATEISGKSFEYMESRYSDGWVEYVDHIVVDREQVRKFSRELDPGTLNYLVDWGHAICFSRHADRVYFYNAAGEINEKSVKINDVEFSYVDDFMKSLVQYCYENGIEKATKKDVNVCMKKFLDDYKREHATNGPILEKVKGEN